MLTTIDPQSTTVRVDAKDAYWMPTKERAIELALGWIAIIGLNASQWRETGAHPDTDHSWIVGLAVKPNQSAQTLDIPGEKAYNGFVE